MAPTFDLDFGVKDGDSEPAGVCAVAGGFVDEGFVDDGSEGDGSGSDGSVDDDVVADGYVSLRSPITFTRISKAAVSFAALYAPGGPCHDKE